MNTSRAVRLALLANLSLVAVGCGGFDASDDPTMPSAPKPAQDPAVDGPKAVPVGGPADASELTEAFGVFVTPRGTRSGDGSRGRPLDTIQGGIDVGKRTGKRVYVCAGTYKEALVLADSISVIGGLDCSDSSVWRAGAGLSRIESPTSPAVRAKAIVTPTRLEGLAVVAPNGSAPSQSSIGLIADGSTLTIARSKISAGDAANGADGVEGAQQVSTAAANGANSYSARQCVAGTTCIWLRFVWNAPAGGAGGTNACDGQPGHAAGNGGRGGQCGIYEEVRPDGLTWVWQPQNNNPTFNATAGELAGGGAVGANGTDGASARTSGTFTSDGYVPVGGVAGADGAAGAGGAGGNGNYPSFSAGSVDANYFYRGVGGAGGGAGGCAGLAGAPGGGGGASTAAVLVDSTIRFDGTELVAGRGGAGGRGTFGSDPTPGGVAGAGGDPQITPFAFGKDGGRGGAAGISGHGASGPSVGIAFRGKAPTLQNGSKATPGVGGDALPAATRATAFGGTKTIPATSGGASKDILAL